MYDWSIGLHFHVIGEGVVRLKSKRRERIYDKENYIDFRMRLLGEPGKLRLPSFWINKMLDTMPL